MNVLVTGGAGYIGSVVVEELVRKGNYVVVLDNLSQGHREAVEPKAKFIYADLSDLAKLADVFRNCNVEAVMHLAAESTVGDSMTDPRKYFQTNVIHSTNLLDAMVRHDVRRLVFSSSAAVYGEPKEAPIKEDAPAAPANAYGESKAIFERILHWYGRAYGLKFISLRYFNAAGASERFGEHHKPETHLIPNVLQVALGQTEAVPVFGIDYPTPDGTCIRDYIHVLDIAQAHILALQYLETDRSNKAYNLGSNRGYSVTEVIETARRITGAAIPIAIHPRRAGDPAILVASSKLAESELGWQPQYSDIDGIVGSAWQWQKRHPYGYRE